MVTSPVMSVEWRVMLTPPLQAKSIQLRVCIYIYLRIEALIDECQIVRKFTSAYPTAAHVPLKPTNPRWIAMICTPMAAISP